MKLSNFQLIKTEGRTALDKKYFASVDVTTESGMLFWKKSVTVNRQISKNFAGSWFFVDDGTWCPNFQAEALARAFSAQTGIEC